MARPNVASLARLMLRRPVFPYDKMLGLRDWRRLCIPAAAPTPCDASSVNWMVVGVPSVGDEDDDALTAPPFPVAKSTTARGGPAMLLRAGSIPKSNSMGWSMWSGSSRSGSILDACIPAGKPWAALALPTLLSARLLLPLPPPPSPVPFPCVGQFLQRQSGPHVQAIPIFIPHPAM